MPELIGLRFGDLEVVEYLGQRSDGKRIWRCVCVKIRAGEQCNNTRVVTTAALNQPTTRCCRKCGADNLRRARRAHLNSFFR